MASEIEQWLAGLGLAAHAEVFRDHEIDLDAARDLNEEDLRELGLPMGPRKKLLRAIGELDEAPDVAPAAALSVEAERRQLTVLFSDLVGSTRLSQQLDAETLREVMGRYQDTVSALVAAEDGHVAKYLGDGVLAYFGWPHAHEDQSERAARAGLRIAAAVAGLSGGGEPLAARVGIATGAVVVGELSGESGAITGETPNLAARLQAEAAPGEVVISDVTRRLLGEAFALDDLGARALDGFEAPVPLWRLRAERVVDSRFEAARGTALTPFIGRASELALLEERWALARGGEGQVVLISGEAGIGKSRLSERLRRRLAGERLHLIRHQASQQHTNTPLHAPINSLRSTIGFRAEDTVAVRLDKLAAWLTRSGIEDAETAALYADLFDLDYEGRWPRLTMTPAEQRRRTFEALTANLLRLAADRPVLMIVEDMHWANPTGLELVEAQVAAIREAAVLMVVTHRPQWQASFRNHAHVAILQLSRLGRAQGADIARAVGGDGLGDDAVARIVARADGVPLFIEELTKTVLEEGEDDDIPTSLQASLLARLDRLGPEARELAQLGATIGREFSRALLGAVSTREASAIDAALDLMVQAELVYRQSGVPDERYIFKHALVQDTAYDSLLRARRRELHGRIAGALARDGDDGEPGLLAHHYTEAAMTVEAVDAWRRAGELALRQSAMVEALRHLETGLDLLATLPEDETRDSTELDYQLIMGRALMAAQGQSAEGAAEAYARARDLGRKLGDARRQFRALWGAWRNHLMRANYRQATEIGADCVVQADASGDTALVLGAGFAYGGTLALAGDLVGARDHLERMLPLHDAEAHASLAFDFGQDPVASMLAYLCWVHWALGDDRRARARGDAGLALARRLDHPLTLSQVLNYVALGASLRCDWPEVRRLTEENVAFAEARGFPQTYWLAVGLRARAVFALDGDAAAVDALEHAAGERRAIGLKAGTMLEHALLADAQLAAGRHEAAGRTLSQSIAFARESGEQFHLAEHYRLDGVRLLAEGERDAARARFQEALDHAAARGALALELRAAVDLARMEPDAARHRLAEIVARFEADQDTAELAQARRLLAVEG